MRDRRLEYSFFDSQFFTQKLLIFIDCAQHYSACNVPVLVFFYYLSDGFSVLRPHLMSDEGRISEHELEKIIELFGNFLGLIEIILEIVWVLFSELFV